MDRNPIWKAQTCHSTQRQNNILRKTNKNLNVKYNFPSLSYFILQEINAYSVDLEKMNKPAMYMYFWCRQFLRPQKASCLKNEWNFIKRNKSEPFFRNITQINYCLYQSHDFGWRPEQKQLELKHYRNLSHSCLPITFHSGNLEQTLAF